MTTLTRWTWRVTPILVCLALLPGCSTIARLAGGGPKPFVVTTDFDAPHPTGNPVMRERRLFLSIVDGLRQEGKPHAALAFLDDYERRYSGDPEARLLRADCLLDIGDTRQAAALYRTLIDGKHAAAAYAGLGEAEAAAKQWSAAASEFARAARLAPSTVAYVNNLGYARMQAGQYTQAEFSLRQATELDPASASARDNLILCEHRDGHDAEARATLDGITDPTARDGIEQLMQGGVSP